MIEKERKFLLKYLPDFTETDEIKQAYIMFDGNAHLRVRIINDMDATMTLKKMLSDTVRHEYEYEIPLSDALNLYNESNCKLTKVRHKTIFEGNLVDIDIYENGLRIVEIEYTDELTNLPDYCGQEVTGVSEYSNITIAKNWKP